MVLVPAVVDAVKIPAVAIGGIADGRGMAAAFALGAEGIGMGTRLSITKESPVHDFCKKKQLESGIEDTIYSNRFDALYCRVLKTLLLKEHTNRAVIFARIQGIICNCRGAGYSLDETGNDSFFRPQR